MWVLDALQTKPKKPEVPAPKPSATAPTKPAASENSGGPPAKSAAPELVAEAAKPKDDSDSDAGSPDTSDSDSDAGSPGLNPKPATEGPKKNIKEAEVPNAPAAAPVPITSEPAAREGVWGLVKGTAGLVKDKLLRTGDKREGKSTPENVEVRGEKIRIEKLFNYKKTKLIR